MNIRRTLQSMLVAVVALWITVPAARPDTWSEKTQLTFGAPVEIPGKVLPPGTYWFTLAEINSDRNVVQIFSSDWSKLYATLLTDAAQREDASDTTVLTVAERPSGRPEAILTWYYPGQTIGHQFIYPGKEEKELSRDMRQNMSPESSG